MNVKRERGKATMIEGTATAVLKIILSARNLHLITRTLSVRLRFEIGRKYQLTHIHSPETS